VRDTVPDMVPDLLWVELTLGVGVSVNVGFPDVGSPERVPLRLGEGVPVGEPVPEGVLEPLGVAVGEPLRVLLGMSLSVPLGEPLRVPVEEAGAVALPVVVAVALPVAEAVAVGTTATPSRLNP
jgi:hypothetical protein